MRKQGFTLIELLAVIIILAIIALIAVPTIMNIISKASKSAFKDSAYGIIKAGELYYFEREMLGEPLEEKTFEFPDAIGLEIKGSKPTSGSMKITKDGDIVLAISNGKYCVKKGLNDTEVTIDENIEDCKLPVISTPKTISDIAVTSTELGVESVDACATSGTCANGTAFAIKVNDSETYKFYVIADDGNEVTLIMNKNLINNLLWITEDDYVAAEGTDYGPKGNSDKGPLTALKALEERTAGWTNIASYNYTLEDDKPDKAGSTVMYQPIERINVRARILTYTEATNLGCTTSSNSCPAYLHENLSNSNTEEQPDRYWLSTAYSAYSASAWNMSYSGDLSLAGLYEGSNSGVRPVIKVSKN